MSVPTPPDAERPASRNDAVAVISAAGAFRVLLVVLAVWTFFEGFALFTGGLDALSLGGRDARTAEQIIGAQMMVFVPVYALLAWQRERYRLLIWVPYGAQLAIIIPTTWALLFRSSKTDGLLLLVVSASFFALLFYFWWYSHPLDFFSGNDDEEYDEDEDEDDVDDEAEDDDVEDDGSTGRRPSTVRRGVRARDVARKPGRFRRRDG